MNDDEDDDLDIDDDSDDDSLNQSGIGRDTWREVGNSIMEDTFLLC